MKLIKAIIKPFKLEEVKEALSRAGVTGMSVTEIRGFGHQRGHGEVAFTGESYVDFVPKIMIELVVPSDKVDSLIETIVRSARTGKVGDGKIFVLPVERAVRIRTDEEGVLAL